MTSLREIGQQLDPTTLVETSLSAVPDSNHRDRRRTERVPRVTFHATRQLLSSENKNEQRRLSNARARISVASNGRKLTRNGMKRKGKKRHTVAVKEDALRRSCGARRRKRETRSRTIERESLIRTEHESRLTRDDDNISRRFSAGALSDDTRMHALRTASRTALGLPVSSVLRHARVLEEDEPRLTPDELSKVAFASISKRVPVFHRTPFFQV